MGASHEHSGRHDHAAGMVGAPRRTLAAVLALTTSILVVETVGAWWSGSLALLADAGHMLTDAGGLALALGAAVLAARPATDRFTWGFRRAEVLAAAVQAGVLLAVGAYIVFEGVQRLFSPPPVSSGAMVVFGVIGLAGNAVSIVLLARARTRHGENLNTRAAMLEVINDALGSVAVLVAAAVIAVTGWTRADAIVSLLIGALILPRTWNLLRHAMDVLLEAAPRDVNLAQVREHLLGVEHVLAVHDLHASTVSTGLPILSAHIVVEDDCFYDGHLRTMLAQLQTCLAGHFDVEHSTFQFEAGGHVEHEHLTHA